ncbi:S-adenosyl methyltransferase [Prauserella marina]|uniref:S-adenosyl methyltransferase n=1 Tax=Prauserella marina TaxID=530584 RepID=A0A1G6LT55_9PSEU|nr:SAM-dependent methyltransferase [Prauserella marina]SDC45935.1 S-adenosyl methyltransferase [Prauserella marina]
MPYLVRSQRALLGRMVRHLLGEGITQFLDLGSGIPTRDHVHEVVQSVDPSGKVVYVDIDPHVVAVGRDVLAGNDNATIVQADFRDHDAVFATPEVARLIDPEQPLAILMIEAFVHISDEDGPAGIVSGYRDRVSTGSYLAISHCSENEDLLAAYQMFERMALGAPPIVNLRSREELTSYFARLDLIEPGVVPIHLWRPESDDEVDRNPDQVQMHAGMGRKL